MIITPVNIAIADNHNLFRSTFRQVLQGLGHKVIIEATNGKVLVEMLNCTPLPDLCILDVNMPVMDGIQTARHLERYFPAIRILLCTMNCDIQMKVNSKKLPVSGVIAKHASLEEYDEAIRRVMALQN